MNEAARTSPVPFETEPRTMLLATEVVPARRIEWPPFEAPWHTVVFMRFAENPSPRRRSEKSWSALLPSSRQFSMEIECGVGVPPPHPANAVTAPPSPKEKLRRKRDRRTERDALSRTTAPAPTPLLATKSQPSTTLPVDSRRSSAPALPGSIPPPRVSRDVFPLKTVPVMRTGAPDA